MKKTSKSANECCVCKEKLSSLTAQWDTVTDESLREEIHILLHCKDEARDVYLHIMRLCPESEMDKFRRLGFLAGRTLSTGKAIREQVEIIDPLEMEKGGVPPT